MTTRRIATALGLALSLACAAPPPSDGGVTSESAGALVEVVSVDDARLGALEADARLAIDLSLPDVVYELDAAAALADARVEVRTSEGATILLGQFLAGHEPTDGRRSLWLAGDANDIDAVRGGEGAAARTGAAAPSEVGATSEALRATGGLGSVGCGNSFSCNPFGCSCSGDADCNDMFCSDVCGGDAICDTTNDVTCWCFRWGRATVSSVAFAR